MNGDVLALGNTISQALAKVFARSAIRRSNSVASLLIASPVALLLAIVMAVGLGSPVTSAFVSLQRPSAPRQLRGLAMAVVGVWLVIL